MIDQRDLDPPTIDKRGRVIVHAPNGTNEAGWLGRIPERDAEGFVTDRDSHGHRLRALDAYAFSLTTLETLDKSGVEYVLVFEFDTGDVYEWKLDAVLYGDEVPDKFLDHDSDPQKYVPRESARAVWRDHGGDHLRNSDERDPDTYAEQGFERASEVESSDHLALTPSQIEERELDPSEVDEVISRDDPRHPRNSQQDDDAKVVATVTGVAGNQPPTESDDESDESDSSEGAGESTPDETNAESDDTSASDDESDATPEVDDDLRALLDEFDAESVDDLTPEQRLEVASRRGGM